MHIPLYLITLICYITSLFLFPIFIQLARLTWWTRHFNTPEIHLENQMCQSAEMTSAKEENNLDSIPWENGDLEQKEYKGILSVSVQAAFYACIKKGCSIHRLSCLVHGTEIVCPQNLWKSLQTWLGAEGKRGFKAEQC